jgi:drug/metabolite transporter (DMT)-like permease
MVFAAQGRDRQGRLETAVEWADLSQSVLLAWWTASDPSVCCWAMLLKVLLLILGVFTCSTAVIMIKRCGMHPIQLAGVRLVIAGIALSPVFLRQWRRHRRAWSPADLRRTLLPGLLLGLHFITWIVGARLTLAANSSLIVNMVPVALPFFLFFVMRERLNAGEWIGTALAMTGMLILGGMDYHLSWRHFTGDVMCFISMLLFAGYLVLGRRNRDVPAIWLYLVPLYLLGGVFCLIIWPISLAVGFDPASTAAPAPVDVSETTWDWLMALGLGIIPTVIGHSILNHAMRTLRGQAVGIANLGQFIFAGIMGYLLLSPPEVPNWNFYVAAVGVVLGALIALRYTPPASTIPPPEARTDALETETRVP